MKKLLISSFVLLVQYAYAQNDSATHYFGLAKQAFSERKFQLSERYYTKGLKFSPTNIDAQLDLAKAYMEMKKYGNATMQYKAVYAAQPTNLVAIEQLANLCYMNRQWIDAQTFGKLCLDRRVGSKMNYLVAKSYYAQEDFINSSKYLEAASKEDPKNADIPYTMANIWLEMSQVKRAIDMYNIALGLDTTNAMWYYELGNIYNDLGEPKNALVNYEKALQKGMDTDIGFNTTLGLVYISNGQDVKGLALIDKVVAKKPMDKTIYNNVAYAFYDVNKFDKAIEWWDKILILDKTDAKALYMIGIAFRKSGNEEKGNRLCDAAIALEPKLAGLKKQMMPPEGMGL